MKKLNFSRVLCFVACFFLIHSAAMAAEDFTMITTDELKAKMDAGETFTLVNALSPIEFKELTIKGSVNIPSSRVTADNPLLPADKSSLLIFFCKGPKCSKSKKAAKIAMKFGYSNVMVYNEGLPAWAKKRYPIESQVKYPKVKLTRLSPQEVKGQMNSAVLLDIRGEEVKKVGKINGAISIPLDDMEDKYATLPKGKKIIIIDHAGKQVNICGKFLHMNGYEDLAAMDGGVLAWKRAGLPVE
ncbi:MAG: hypothetical protein KQH63_14735 [Desulfobulbaceae bacterium]|nr:hypothetical protein [Desulfobulbaceae bacterium]